VRRVRCEEREVMGLVAKAEEALRRGFHGGRELGPDSHGGGGGSVSSSASSNAGTGRRKGVGGRKWRSWRGKLQRRSSGTAGSLVGRQPWRSASVCARARAERGNERGGEL